MGTNRLNNCRPGPGVQGGADDKEIGTLGRLGHATKRAPHAVVAAHLGFGFGGSGRHGERIVPVLPLGRTTAIAYDAEHARGSPSGIYHHYRVFSSWG